MTQRLLFRVHAALSAAGIPAALIGAAALAVHGVSRSTLDQDLLVTDVRALEHGLWAILSDVSVDVRRGDADDPLAGVVRIAAQDERDVDVVVGRHSWQRDIVEEAALVALPAGSLPVVAPAGLVLLKLYAGGPQDLWDVVQLRAISGSELDEAVSRRLAALPAAAREAWRRVTAGS